MTDNLPNENLNIPNLIAQDVTTSSTLQSNYTAEITIAGLALLYFSDGSKSAELGFINQAGHPFLMTINNTPVTVDSGSVVTLNAANTGIGSVYHSSDSLDFRQIIDLNNIHGSEIKLNSAYEFFAKVQLNNAVFYTMERSVFEANLVPKNGTQTINLGRIGKVGGARIYDSNFTIKVDGRALDLSAYSAPYKILLHYQCPVNNAGQVSDFDLVYDALDTSNCANKNIYDLVYAGDEPTGLSQAVAEYISALANKAIDSLNGNEETSEETLRLLEEIKTLASCEVACQMTTIGTKVLE